MADNIEGSAANAMAGSQASGRSAAKDLLKNLFIFKGSGNSGSSGGSGGSGATGNGWTAEDYKNYGDWQERTQGLKQNDREHKALVKGTVSANNSVLANQSLNAHHIRTKDLLTHASQYGQVGNVSTDENGRSQVAFRAAPARTRTAGYGKGAQGTSKQQGAAAKIGKVAGTVLGGIATENPAGAAAGAKLGEKLGGAIDNKITTARANRGKKA